MHLVNSVFNYILLACILKFQPFPELLPCWLCDTKWDTFCKARTAFSKRIVKFSVIAMSFVDRCYSYSLNNSSKSVKNKLHWPFISFWLACVTSRSLPSAILLSNKFSSPQTLSVETGQLGPNLLTRILSCWHEFWVVDLDRF